MWLQHADFVFRHELKGLTKTSCLVARGLDRCRFVGSDAGAEDEKIDCSARGRQ